MTTFIILAVIMCVAAVLAVAVPLWRGASASPDADRREALRKKQQAEQFKRRYFELYDDVKISYKEDW